MNQPPVQRKRLYHRIVSFIREEIEEGKIVSGAKLPSERSLASTLDVSRTSVKEAFSVLESAGVVSIRQGSGVYLLPKSTDETLKRINSVLHGRSTDRVELMELRQAVEGDAAFYAAVRSDQEDLDRLELAYGRLESAVGQGSIAADEDLQFHMDIAKAARNSLFYKVMDMVYEELLTGLEESRTKTLEIPGKSNEILEEHLQILDAIKSGDGKSAREAMRSHLQKVKQRYL